MGSFKDLRVLPNPWKIKADIYKHHYFREYFQSSSHANAILPIYKLTLFRHQSRFIKPLSRKILLNFMWCAKQKKWLLTDQMAADSTFIHCNLLWVKVFAKSIIDTISCLWYSICKKKIFARLIYLLLLTEIVYVHHYSANSRFQ